MSHEAKQAAEKALADRRRQAYFRRRRSIQRTAARTSLLRLDHLSIQELHSMLGRELYELVAELEGGSSPRLYEAARRGAELHDELLMRGEQLELPFFG